VITFCASWLFRELRRTGECLLKLAGRSGVGGRTLGMAGGVRSVCGVCSVGSARSGGAAWTRASVLCGAWEGSEEDVLSVLEEGLLEVL